MNKVLKAIDIVYKDLIYYPYIEISTNRTTFFQGTSGSGKSTLFKLFNATVSPDSGRLVYNGKDIEELDTVLLRQKILLVSQSVYLFSGTIRENFKKYYGYRSLKEPSEEQMLFFLSLCCAEFPLDTYCDNMSGGERQRVYLAICLSLLPEVLMLDEPSSALDGLCAEMLIGNIKNFCMQKGITLLIVSHDTYLAEKYADEVVCLEGCVRR